MKLEDRISQLRGRIDDQRDWIARCGGSLEGYIDTYGKVDQMKTVTYRGQEYEVPGWYGNGGEAIYQADIARLEQMKAELNHFEMIRDNLLPGKDVRGKPAKMPKGYFGWRLLDGEIGSNTLKSGLHNLSEQTVNREGHTKYCQGFVIGMMTAYIAAGMEYDDVKMLVSQHLPGDVDKRRLPLSWEATYNEC